MIGFLFRAAIAAVGLWLATLWINGIYIAGPWTLIFAAVLLGVVNAVVRPIAVIVTFPFTVLTLGLFLLLVNAAMLGLVALLLPGFYIDGVWTAVLAALLVSITGWVGSLLIGSNAKVEVYRRRG